MMQLLGMGEGAMFSIKRNAFTSLCTMYLSISVCNIYSLTQKFSFESCKDAVVQLFVITAKFDFTKPFKSPDQGGSLGSGFFISPAIAGDEGYILTNFHVVESAGFIQIQVPSRACGKERFDVEVVGVYPERDIALLRLKDKEKKRLKKMLGSIPYLEIGSSDEVKRGDTVTALGYPLGQQGLKFSRGVVSGSERLSGDGNLFIQVDAAVNSGNSGGPSVNKDGHVVGINTCGPHPDYFKGVQNIAYIIPINDVVNQLPNFSKVSLLCKPFWGIDCASSHRELAQLNGNPLDGGIYVSCVYERGILSNTGLCEGDIIYKVNDILIDMYGEISVPWSQDKISVGDYLDRLCIGDMVKFEIYRLGIKKQISITLTGDDLITAHDLFAVREKYPQYEHKKIDYECIGGLVVMELTLNHIDLFGRYVENVSKYKETKYRFEKRLIITNILSNSQAMRSRSLREGTIIELVNGEKVHSLQDFRQALHKSKQSGYIVIISEDKRPMVLELARVLEDEDRLATENVYDRSVIIDVLES